MTEARRNANKRWNDAHKKELYDQVGVLLPKGEKEVFQAAAVKAGVSMSRYIADCVRERIASGTPTPSRWIPVGERLPEVSTDPRYPKNAYSIEVTGYISADKENDEEEMITTVHYDFTMQVWKLVTVNMVVDVTHWMPLPEPPKQNVGYWFHTGQHKALFDPPEECLECSVCGFQMDYDEPPAVCPNCHSLMKWGGYKQ